MLKYLYKIGIYPARAYWFIFRPKTYGVKCLIENEKGETLFIKHTYGFNTWSFPGGGIERGETREQAVRREVVEEVGIKLEKVDKIGEIYNELEYKRDTIYVFRASIVGTHGVVQESEIAQVLWARENNLPQPVSPIVLEILNLI